MSINCKSQPVQEGLRDAPLTNVDRKFQRPIDQDYDEVETTKKKQVVGLGERDPGHLSRKMTRRDRVVDDHLG